MRDDRLFAHMDSGGKALLLIPNGMSAASYAQQFTGEALPEWVACGNAEGGFAGWVQRRRIEAVEIKAIEIK